MKSIYFEKAMMSARPLLADLRAHPEVIRAELAGEYRRGNEAIHTLDFLVETRNPAGVASFFASHPLVESVMAGEGRAVILKDGPEARLHDATAEAFPFVWNALTGSAAHREQLGERALQCGLRLEREGFHAPDAAVPVPVVRTEEDLYRALGLAYVEPELREGRGEVEAALKGTLPRLVEAADLRGTFHCHTRASDGSNTLEEMAAEAKRLGFDYLGIADHSRSSHKGLDGERLLAQVEAIGELNASLDGIHLFSGIECDILPDGSLDLPDAVLARVDFVVASLHSHLLGDDLRESVLTDRLIGVMSNPYVTMMGHVSGRVVAGRHDFTYQVDIPAIIEAAAGTGTILELNAAPFRMDLAPEWWPCARGKGVLASINPDAHQAARLNRVMQGVNAARKGWLTRADVINTLPLSEVAAVLRRKRERLARV